MGLSSKQVTSDHGFDWSQTLLQELPKPHVLRRQNQQQQSTSEPLKCPRCDSTNTKFCYYNNYNKSQPRHFCKTCKRHWTKGGTLRNVPVGGGRKNKKPKSSKNASKVGAAAASTSTSTTSISANNNGNIINRVNPHMVLQAQQQKHNVPVSEIMFRALNSPPSSVLQQNSISSSNGGILSSALSSLPQNQGLQFPYSSSSCFDAHPSSISFVFSNLYNHMEDSTVTTIVPNTSSSISTQQWQMPNNNASRGMDMSSSWNWDDIDTFVSTDHLNIPWDDSELKP